MNAKMNLKKVKEEGKKLTDLEYAQNEYILAKSENDTLMDEAKEKNAADYIRLVEEQDKEEIESIMANISRRNGELGLYNSNTRLCVAEKQLLKETRKALKPKMKAESFELLDEQIFKNEMLIGIQREKALDLCLRVEL